MAQKRYRQGPWPPKTDDQPIGWFQSPEVVQRSDRPLAGPLRFGTMPPVGPRRVRIGSESDFGMDRISPKDFDPMGTCRNRFGSIESTLVSSDVRKRR